MLLLKRTSSSRLLQRHRFTSWVAAHPDAAAVALTAGAIAAAAWVREAQVSHRANESRRREQDLQQAKLKVEECLREALSREERLQSSIAHRGQLGERALESLIARAKESGHARDYKIQPTLSNGSRPDAVIELPGERMLVVDSKAPVPPSEALDGDETARLAYVDTLKVHIAALGSKRYHAEVAGALPRTWLLLPGEGYLQAAYNADGEDSEALHLFADARGVTLVGPHGLRSALHLWRILQSDVELEERLREQCVQQRLQQLQPLWSDQVLPRSRTLGKDLKKVVAGFNELAGLVISFDEVLSKDVLGLPKRRKTSLPPTLAEPASSDCEERDSLADAIICTAEAESSSAERSSPTHSEQRTAKVR